MKMVIMSLAILVSFQIFAAGNTTKAKSPAVAEKMNVDTTQSKMLWTGSKITGSSHNGAISLKSGTIEVKNAMVTGGQFEVDMDSLTNDDLKGSPEDMNKLVGHLKSDDFFSVKTHPTAVFKIGSVKAIAGKENMYQVDGKLIIKGQTKPVSFPSEIKIVDGQASANAKFEIDRTVWGLKYGSGKFFKGLGDKVINDPIQFELNLVAKK
jgi:polyisoprenoid-binding protein YceI